MQVDNHDEMMDALRELDATPEELAAWVPIVQRMASWSDPPITPHDQGRLLSLLGSALPQRSPVRQAVQQRLSRRNRLVALLATAHCQISVLRLSFWLLSGALILLGVAIELAPVQSWLLLFWLRALAPLLAYLGVASMFRSAELQTLEYELACPPSALQFIFARLIIVLSYDIALGMVFSLVGWAVGEGGFLVITLHWLAPLLFASGLALALSLRLSALAAVGLPYGAWLSLLILNTWRLENLASVLSFQGEVLLSLAGLTLLVFALWRFTRQLPRHFLAPAV
ncbi:MAG TPA: hypothetical protein VKQ36_11460 [Ktedonobacterales bacterium]|nr:hypothetical protein [Ktedonobacterales bacterium]